MEPREIRPGVLHWTAAHPKIRIEVSSYWLADAKVLLDPLLPTGGLAWLCEVYRRLCDLEWDTLLLAHGLPLVGDGKEKLRAFAGG